MNSTGLIRPKGPHRGQSKYAHAPWSRRRPSFNGVVQTGHRESSGGLISRRSLVETERESQAIYQRNKRTKGPATPALRKDEHGPGHVVVRYYAESAFTSVGISRDSPPVARAAGL